jgi:hypothetical protein
MDLTAAADLADKLENANRPRGGGDSVCFVIASPAQPGVAIQLHGLLRRSAGQQSSSQ